jgi:protease I
MSQHIFRLLAASETSAAVPRISNAKMLSEPENKGIHDIWVNEPENTKEFAGKRIAVIATDGVEEIELTTVLHFFRSRGASVHLVSPKKPDFPAIFGIEIPDIRATHIQTIHYIETAGWIAFDRLLDSVSESEYDAAVIPGGVWNPDSLRADPKVLDFICAMAAKGKIVASICHGPWVLADAGLLKGRRATAWWSMKNDLTNAGATYIDEPVVIDGKFITSRSPTDLAEFVAAVGAAL